MSMSVIESIFGALALLTPPPTTQQPTAPAQPQVAPSPSLSDAELLAAAEADALAKAKPETIEVSSDAPAESASSVHLGRELLRFRSKTQPSDLLRQVPGLVVSQHAGG